MERKIEKSGKDLTLTVKFNQDDVWEMVKKIVEQGNLAPVVHAHWERDDENHLCCSRCGAIHGGGFSYCSYCGAIMDEEVK